MPGSAKRDPCRAPPNRPAQALSPDPFSGAYAAASAATVPCEAQGEWGAQAVGAAHDRAALR